MKLLDLDIVRQLGCELKSNYVVNDLVIHKAIYKCFQKLVTVVNARAISLISS